MNSEKENVLNGTDNALGASEVEAKEDILGGFPAQMRIWEYKSHLDGNINYEVRVSTLKNNVFYTIEMVSKKSDYSNYEKTFNDIKNSFKFL